MLRKIPDDGADKPEPSRSRAIGLRSCFAVLILTPSMIGFVMKFYEFVHTFRDDSAAPLPSRRW